MPTLPDTFRCHRRNDQKNKSDVVKKCYDGYFLFHLEKQFC